MPDEKEENAMKRLLSILLVLLLCASSALAETLTTNGGVTLETTGLTYFAEDSDAPTVYYIADISPESLVQIYEALGVTLPGKVGVKMSTGESTRSNYLRPDLIADLTGHWVLCWAAPCPCLGRSIFTARLRKSGSAKWAGWA